MGDLHLSADTTGPAVPRTPGGSRLARLGRGVRSGLFFLLYFLYLLLVVGAGQRLVIWPAVVLLPRRRERIVGAWLCWCARATLFLARLLADVRVSVGGIVPPGSCIVLMNHQSVLDIAIGLSLVTRPYPLIPTRARYRRGLPGISPLIRLARYPFVTQKRVPARDELADLTRAFDEVARGDQSLLIYPEGHRTRDGEIGRFMRTGLRLALARARQPIYCIVADGMAHTRTFAESFMRFAGTRVRVVILGPFDPPAPASVDACIDELRDRMVAALAELRATPSGPAPRAATAAAP